MPHERNQLRIIGGRWRGRRLAFPTAENLRPTPDRFRETVFNWLQTQVAGARVLDAFAGSGALGFEAASRGAAEGVLVEQNAAVAKVLQANIATLQAEQLTIVRDDVLNWLRRAPVQPFDVVFLDPPFSHSLLLPTCECLAERGWLAAGARVYVESGEDLANQIWPAGWELIREKRAGGVCFGLLAVSRDLPRNPQKARK